MARDDVLYDSAMGSDVKGGSVKLNADGAGTDHHVVYGDDRHFSWDTDKDGNVSGVHGTEHTPSGNKLW